MKAVVRSLPGLFNVWLSHPLPRDVARDSCLPRRPSRLIYQDEILLRAAARKLPQPRECLGVPGAIALPRSARSQCSGGAPSRCKRRHCQLRRLAPGLRRGGAPVSQPRCLSLQCHLVSELKIMVYGPGLSSFGKFVSSPRASVYPSVTRGWSHLPASLAGNCYLQGFRWAML